GYDTAKLLYEKLKQDGYSVFFVLYILENGNFDNELEKRVRKCKDFLLLLSPGIFDRFSEYGYNPKEDWVRQEIVCALETNKNIIPLVLDDFAYPRRLPNDIKEITRKNAIEFNPTHFEAAYAKLKESFLISKPNLYTRYKTRMRNFIITMFLIFAAGTSLAIYEILRQKDLEIERKIAEERVMAQQREDSIKAVKDEEIARRDSIIRELEMARALDSIGSVIETEIERVTDSMMRHISVPTGTPKQNAPTTAAAKKPSKKTLHWGGPNDAVGQAVFGKISAAGVNKTKCAGDGVLITANKPACKTVSGKVTCSYSPRLTLTTCGGKTLNSMKKNVNFNSNPQKNEIVAKEELAKKIRTANFSDWVSVIKKY
ncbi:MAG: toll/interleukin-1 receptor domain-containing protein, partial [Fibromonadaceae bacterium]|nr:toll/interleukin-1 receptor domain-containing protein [Fibromonadaceae bacterium]